MFASRFFFRFGVICSLRLQVRRGMVPKNVVDEEDHLDHKREK